MPATKKTVEITLENCQDMIRPVRDALEVLNGKWKLAIIGSLSFGTKRFKQISKEVNGITDKVLSKELKALEANQLVKREVFDTFPPTVEYSITHHGKSLENVIDELRRWSESHRKKIIGR
jgi:DNA-binding HxlR family transcriptional regulator